MQQPAKSRLWLQASVLEFLTAEAETRAPQETGGVLMGYLAQPGGAPVVTWASGPGPEAVHLSCYYSPDSDFDEARIADFYEAAGRRMTYLGDWHTHPYPVRFLSARDKRTLRRIARCRSARVHTPIMLILVADEDWTPMAWQGALKRHWMWRSSLSTVALPVHVF